MILSTKITVRHQRLDGGTKQEHYTCCDQGSITTKLTALYTICTKTVQRILGKKMRLTWMVYT